MLRRTLAMITCAVLLGFYAYWEMPSEPAAVPDSRYQKLDNDGNAISAWSGPWSCVLDRKTGLIWEVKNDSENIHDAYWTYSWFHQDVGIINNGDCYFETDRCDTQDLIVQASQRKTCGISGWRLPTKTELLSLVDHQPKPGAPRIANDFFPHTKRGDYWTADANQPLTGIYSHLKKGAYAVNFIDGKAVVLPYRNAAFVRLVSN